MINNGTEWKIDPVRFEDARKLVENGFSMRQHPDSAGGIGTLREKSVHRVLKYCCTRSGEEREASIGGYVADAVCEDGIIEIQTAGFSRLRNKLCTFLTCCPVTVVWPAERIRWISIFDPETGELLSRRKSPRHQRIYDIFAELYSIRDLLTLPGLRIHAVFLETEEFRFRTGKQQKKTIRCDRIPLKIMEQYSLNTPEDYASLLPEELPERFGTHETASLLKTDASTARMMLRVLEAAGVLREDGREGKRILFCRSSI